MKDIVLTVTRSSVHKSLQNALNEAKSLVSSPREVSKQEQELTDGKSITIESNDQATNTKVRYTVSLVVDDAKPQPKPKVAPVPTPIKQPQNQPFRFSRHHKGSK